MQGAGAGGPSVGVGAGSGDPRTTRYLFVGGVKLPQALAELGLIDEYEFVVQPRLAGHGPTLFAGLSKYIDLKLVSRQEFGSGAVAMRYEARR
jgi:dihydrofolate reductase